MSQCTANPGVHSYIDAAMLNQWTSVNRTKKSGHQIAISRVDLKKEKGEKKKKMDLVQRKNVL